MCRLAVAFTARIYIFSKDVDESSEHNLDIYFAGYINKGVYKRNLPICNIKGLEFRDLAHIHLIMCDHFMELQDFIAMHLNFNEKMMNTIIYPK